MIDFLYKYTRTHACGEFARYAYRTTKQLMEMKSGDTELVSALIDQEQRAPPCCRFVHALCIADACCTRALTAGRINKFPQCRSMSFCNFNLQFNVYNLVNLNINY